MSSTTSRVSSGSRHRPPAPHLAPRRMQVYQQDLTPVTLYLDDLAASPRDSAGRSEATTAPCAQQTEVIRTRVEQNLRLVVSVARTYAPLLRERGALDLADLIQEGNLGLLEAARRYDPEHGSQFSTYAVWWIRQAILRAIRAADTIRLPDYLQLRLHALAREETEKQARAASPGLVPVPRTVSLEGLTHQERRQVWERCDPQALDPAEAIGDPEGTEEQQRWLAEAMQRWLTPRQRTVMEALLGWGDRWRPATLVELARELGVHPERVRQVREAALARLRAAWQAHCQRQAKQPRRGQRPPERLPVQRLAAGNPLRQSRIE